MLHALIAQVHKFLLNANEKCFISTFLQLQHKQNDKNYFP